MIRELAIILLIGAVTSIGVDSNGLAQVSNWSDWYWNSPQQYWEVTGNRIEKFNESPILKARVTAGELPPLEERLPENPKVVKPLKGIGQYQDTLYLPMLSSSPLPTYLYTQENIVERDSRWLGEVIPNILVDWEISTDKKSFTLYSRKGLKWSDGYPFTVDDILFWWEDVMLNKELTSEMPSYWQHEGMRIEKLNDYTVRFHFNVVLYPDLMLYKMAMDNTGGEKNFLLPKHALKKYHVKYNPDADKLAKEFGYDYWWELFNFKKKTVDPDIPTLGPWMLKELPLAETVWERNPYYFKVDTEGNQLPYFDRVIGFPHGDMEARMMRAFSGDYELASGGFSAIADYSHFNKRWSKEKIWEWYKKKPWLVGCNYIPSYAVNTTEWWQEETWDPETIDRELGWLASLGFNTIRSFVQYIVWKQDPEGFKKRFDTFLRIAAKHKISVMPVLFDDCAFGGENPYLGKQKDPTSMWGTSWTPSPGKKLVPQRRGEWPILKRYVQDMITTYGKDTRVIIWDLYNEPGNGMRNSLPLLKAVFSWARQVNPEHPLTASIWLFGLAELMPYTQVILNNSDLINIHIYRKPGRFSEEIEKVKVYGRPIALTEWDGGDHKTDMPYLKKEKVACYGWASVGGRLAGDSNGFFSKEGKVPYPEINEMIKNLTADKKIW